MDVFLSNAAMPAAFAGAFALWVVWKMTEKPNRSAKAQTADSYTASSR
jgi:hypothetical protein